MTACNSEGFLKNGKMVTLGYLKKIIFETISLEIEKRHKWLPTLVSDMETTLLNNFDCVVVWCKCIKCWRLVRVEMSSAAISEAVLKKNMLWRINLFLSSHNI